MSHIKLDSSISNYFQSITSNNNCNAKHKYQSNHNNKNKSLCDSLEKCDSMTNISFKYLWSQQLIINKIE